jgi:hypothetical protein
MPVGVNAESGGEDGVFSGKNRRHDCDSKKDLQKHSFT